MAGQISCDYCNNLVYDEEMEEYVCDVNMDEDDMHVFVHRNIRIVHTIRATMNIRL